MENISKIIKALANKQDQIYTLVCTVDSVNASDRTCDVIPINGDAIIFGVRLQSGLGGNMGIYIQPKKDSQVLVTFLNKNTGYVAMCSDVDSLEVRVGQQTLLIDEQGVAISGFLKLESNSADLKSVLDGLLDQLGSAVITTPAGPGSFDPAFIAQMQIFKAQLATFLK